MNNSPTDRESLEILAGKRALIVDDDAHFLDFLKHLLQKKGIFCLQATNGLQALSVLAAEQVDFILSDINMPEMDGYGLLSAVREDPALASLPIILLTGKPAFSGLRSGLRKGADSYLPKPFDEDTIVETILVCLRRLQRQKDRENSAFNEQRINVLKMLPHELRTPLNGIMAVADLMEMGETTEAELKEYSEILRTSGARLLRLTTNFLICAELQMQGENPERPMRLFDDSVPCKAREITDELEKRALENGRSSDLHLTIEDGLIQIPPEALSKILDEILDNAFKFSSPGDPVLVTGEIDGRLYRWRVEDHGSFGIPVSQLESRGLFIQFDRATNEQQGSGMGLHLVDMLCKQYGGKLNFLATPEQGITVEILLELADDSSQTGPPG